MEKHHSFRMKLNMLNRSYARFCESIIKLNHNKNNVDFETYQDSAYRRFKLTVDPLWKFIRIYLTDIEGLMLQEFGPKATYRYTKQACLVTESELNNLLDMVEDRNENSHDYDETDVEDINKNLPKYCTIIGNVLKRVTLPPVNK